MSLDESLISYAVRYNALTELQQLGLSRDHFVDEYKTVWNYLLRTKRQHDTVPSEETLLARFPDLSLPRVRRRDVPVLMNDVRQRYKFIQLLTSINRVADQAVNYDVVDDVIQTLQGELNSLSFSTNNKSHLVDLFSSTGKERMMEDIRHRRRGGVIGIPTGLKKIDTIAGGLQKQKMVVVMGRTGLGKSWLNLLFVVNAVMNGRSVILYPLEMTLEETAYRLYTLTTSKLFGAKKALKNHDLTMGRVNTRRAARFLNVLEDKFAGKLLVADVGSLADQYTNERIEAEVSAHRPDMFWVDYITLMKPPDSKKSDDGWQSIRQLSNGIATTAKRRNCVGGASAQVSREALKANVFLPRLEHIGYGDSIGQDTDMAVSINRKGPDLYYALVKNRGGPEIGKTKVNFAVNIGVICEAKGGDPDDDQTSA